MAWGIEKGVDEETRAGQVGRMLCRTGFVRVRESHGKLKYQGKLFVTGKSGIVRKDLYKSGKIARKRASIKLNGTLSVPFSFMLAG